MKNDKLTKNKKMKTTKTLLNFSLIILIQGFLLISCDTSIHGKSSIRNESSYVLNLKYNAYSKDTSILIQPNSFTDFHIIGGLGEGYKFDCCPCEFSIISLLPTDTIKVLTKNISDKNNWILTNPNTKRFDYEEINCEFIVKESDIN